MIFPGRFLAIILFTLYQGETLVRQNCPMKSLWALAPFDLFQSSMDCLGDSDYYINLDADGQKVLETRALWIPPTLSGIWYGHVHRKRSDYK